MKILYHHRTLGDGAEGIHIREIVNALRGLGHDVRVVALIGENETSQPSRKRGRWSHVSRLVPRHLYEVAEVSYNVVGRHSIRRAIHRFQPDFVLDRYNSYSTGAVFAARAAGVPCIVEVNAPVAFERVEYPDSAPLCFPALAIRYEKKIFQSADHLYTVSSPLREFLIRERGVDPERVSVLPNGANPDAFRPGLGADAIRTRYGLDSALVIGFVGILRPWHGVDLLIEAFAGLTGPATNAKLLVVGDGPMELALKSEADRLGVSERVVFAGRVAHSEIARYVAAMDIAVSPRATFYASPMKILEYMAMGIPTIAPRMANIEDLLTDGVDSVLFEPEDSSSLQHALETLLADTALRERYGRAAREKIETERNWLQNARRIVEMAERVKQGRKDVS